MDKNTFTGLFLILVIIVASTYFLKPSEVDIKKERQLQDSIALAKSNSGKNPVAAPVKGAATGTGTGAATADSSTLTSPFGGNLTGTNQLLTIENELIKVTISSKGGRVESVELKEYKTYDQKALIMFEGAQNKFGLIFKKNGDSVNTSNLYFTPSGSSFKVVKNDSSSVSFRLTLAEGKYVDYIYSLKGNSYKLGFRITSRGIQDIISSNSNYLTLNWETVLKQKEKDILNEHSSSTAYYSTVTDEVDHLSTTESETKAIGEEAKIQWISFKQHFFSNVLIVKDGFAKGRLGVITSTDPRTVKAFTANLQLPYNNQSDLNYPMEFYFGPNQFSTLNDQGYGLERQIDMGYPPLKYINRYVVLPIFQGLDSLDWNYGIIILVLTLLLKIALSPLTYKSYLSMAKMRVLKPEMDEIKAKVGDDNPTLLQQEYLKLYKKAGVNPLGGCIPMLLQLPIVMAFFFFFPNLFELRQQSFLWMEDLSTYDAFIKFGFDIPFIHSHISLMCILMTVSTLIYTYFNNQISGATGQMKYIGYISPIIFLGVLNSYPSGLNYYYFLANMLTFAQQYLIRFMVDDAKIHAKIQENKKKPASEKKQSGFQKRMEDYMRTQQGKTKELPASTAKPKKK